MYGTLSRYFCAVSLVPGDFRLVLANLKVSYLLRHNHPGADVSLSLSFVIIFYRGVNYAASGALISEFPVVVGLVTPLFSCFV